jgi:hypothetical protein
MNQILCRNAGLPDLRKIIAKRYVDCCISEGAEVLMPGSAN